MNARFWHYHNGDCVKLTMRKGDVIEFNDGGPTDEGYHYTHTQYEFDGEVVRKSCASQSLDCDGRLDQHAEYVCPLEDLRVGNGSDLFPVWQRVRAGQRDYAAEAMGY